MKTSSPATVWAIPRNNLAAALAFARARGDRLTGDERRTLIRLQDDPADLIAHLDPHAPQEAQPAALEGVDIATRRRPRTTS